MKHINFSILIAFLSLSAIIISCKKKKEPEPIVPTCTYLLTRDSIEYSGSSSGTEIRTYSYNANKKIVKITYTYPPSTAISSYDTIAYQVNGEIASVKNFTPLNPTPNSIFTYTYTSGKITTVDESGSNANGPYVRTRTLTYTSGLVSSQTVVYTSGSKISGVPETISSITFTGGNISAFTSSDLGGAVTIVNDLTAPNPFYGLNNDPTDITKLFDANNVTSAYPTAFGPSFPLLTATYTYSNGRVATQTQTAAGSTAAHNYTYTCL
jgi:hypothetical protein